MTKTKHSVLSKLLSVVSAISILVGMLLPAAFYSLAEEQTLGTVEALVPGGTVEGSDVTFRDTELEWSPKNDAIGRSVDGWWIGIKVLAPEGMTEEQLQSAKYISNAEKSFWTAKDSAPGAERHFITLWGVLNEGYLNDAIAAGKNLQYRYQFDWDGNGVYEQPVTMQVDPTKVVLKKSGATVYPLTNSASLAQVQVITGGVTITGDRSNRVTAAHTSKTELAWSPADPAIGRYMDGWWVGINVIAPAGADLSKVTYQNQTNAGWSAEKAFNTYKDTENSIGLWGLVNETYLNSAAAAGKSISYSWRFDWDGDKVYEQLVHMQLDPANIVLKAENGDQVYPCLGTVTPLTGGTVSGNGSTLELRIEEASLNWSPADLSIGRHSDGWWVGMKVTAPEECSAAQLEAAFYNRRVTDSTTESGWGEYQKVLFKDAKDSDREIQMWMILTPATMEKYQTLGKNIATEYVFDWNGDGTNDQTVLLTVVPSEKVVLNKVSQQNEFGFTDPAPADQWVGDTYANIASGGKGTGPVTYTILSGGDVATIDKDTGTLTFKKAGVVTVQAVKAADEVYLEATAQYTVKAYDKSQSEVFKFANSNPVISTEFKVGTFTNAASVEPGYGTGAIRYTVSDKTVATVDDTGTVTFLTAGTVTVTATKEASLGYKEAVISYTLQIEKSQQAALTVTPVDSTITYSPDKQTALSVAGGSGNGAVSYAIVEGGAYASVDPVTGEITTSQAGGSFSVEVRKAGDTGYEAATPVKVTFYVEHAAQAELVFGTPTPQAITYNDNNNVFNNKVTGGSGSGQVTYAFANSESQELASINAATGELTIQAAGTITVIATKAGDTCYKEATATYTLTVNKDTPEFDVPDVSLLYGTAFHQIQVAETLVGDGAYIYTIEGENELGASVDATGKVTLVDTAGKVGSVTIKVTKSADTRYEEEEKTFRLTVSYLKTDATPTFDGEKKNTSGWYTGDITITPPAGYQISYTNGFDAAGWHDSLLFDTEATAGKHSVYLRNDKGITDAIELTGLLLDKTNPSDLSITYTTPAWERFLQGVTFGYYNPTQTEVTLSAKDTGSGIASFTFNYSDDTEDGTVSVDEMTVDANGVASYTFVVAKDYKDTVTFSAFDVAGRETRLQDDKMLVVDFTAPQLNVLYHHTGPAREHDDILYTNKETEVVFEITETNFALSLLKDADKPKVILDGNPLAMDWTQDAQRGVWVASCHIMAVGEHQLSLTYTDLSKNESVTYTKEIRIDTTAPTVQIDYTGTAVKDSIFAAPRTATVKVTEHNFKANEVEVDVTAKDITGAPVELSAKAYTAYAKNPANWRYMDAQGNLVSDAALVANPDDHYLVLPVFDIDAVYEVDVAYTDLAGNAAADYVKDTFTVDRTKPANIQIDYSVSVLDQLFGIFNIYQPDVTVTVTATDVTAGVEYFLLTYTKSENVSDINKNTFTTEKLTPVQDPTDLTRFTATYTIPADARGTVRADVMDNAANANRQIDDTVLVVDDTAPQLVKVEYLFTDDQSRELDDIFYTKKDVTVRFTIDEANFDLSLGTGWDTTKAKPPVAMVNGVERAVTWSQVTGTDEWVGEVTLTGNGDYVVTLTYEDRSTNVMASYAKEIHIDNEAPDLTVTYDNTINSSYYKLTRTATVKVTEHNFKADEVEVDIQATDIAGIAVNLSAKAYTAYAKNPANWRYMDAQGNLVTDVALAVNPDDHYLVLPTFDIEGRYEVKINYTDLAENKATPYTTAFVYDKTRPTNMKIEYSTPVIEKIFSAVTFGFYQPSVTVTVKATEYVAGVEYFKITYTKSDNVSDINKETYTTKKLTAVQDPTDPTLFTATYTIPAQARGTVFVQATDFGAKVNGKADETTVVVVDDTAPQLVKVEYLFTDDQSRELDDIFYTKKDVTVRFTIDEANFDLSLLTAQDETKPKAPVAMVNGVEQTVTWTQVAGTDEWIGEVKLAGNGDYRVTLTYEDRSTNAMADFAREIHIDNELPVIAVTYDNNVAQNGNYYKADRTATVKVTEHNFKADEVKVDVTAKDITGAPVELSAKAYTAYAKNPANWRYMDAQGNLVTDVALAVNPDDHYLVLPTFDIEGRYEMEIAYTDLAENEATPYTTAFVYDKTRPTNMKIEYSTPVIEKIFSAVTFGFYQPSVTVTVKATEYVAGVEYFKISYFKSENVSDINKNTFTTEKLTAVQDLTDPTLFTATYTLPADARGTVFVQATDFGAKVNGKTDDTTLVVDDKAPQLVDVAYVFASGQHREHNDIFYTKKDVTVRFTIDEANFDLSLLTAQDETKPKAPVAMVNGVEQAVTWTPVAGTDEWVGEVTLTGNGDYVVTLTYEDRSANAMADFAREIHIDNELPVIAVTYDYDEANNGNYYKKDRTATVKVTEHNFKADEVEVDVTATDITGAPVNISAKAYTAYAKTPANWRYMDAQGNLVTDVALAANPDDHYLVLPTFDIEAHYVVKINYTDLAENVAVPYETKFVVDKSVATDVKIEYSQHIQMWKKLLNAITFGYYSYADSVTVTLTADDITAGVDYFTWTYTKEPGTSDLNKTDETKVIPAEEITYSNNGKTATASFVIDAQARGHISAEVTDRAANTTVMADNTTGMADNTRINVVDTIAPTRTVSFQPERVLDAATLTDVSTFQEGDNVILYYTEAAVVTFTVNEANFYAEDVEIRVNGDKVVPADWKQNGDVWTGTITIRGDGDYVVTMTYADRSANRMVAYQSQKIAIDGTAPTISVTYDNESALNTNHYKADRTATIVIVDHNFRADDVVATVTAVDIQGNPVTVPAYAAYLCDRSNWISSGDTHVAQITYATDATYTFDIAYTDLIGNAAADFAKQTFVVDHKAPTDLKITYSEAIVEKVIEAITFGFYKPSVTVTLTADDITSGVDYFDWTYTREDTVSDKNAESSGARIPTDHITYSDNGKTATAVFTVPADARGYISATVTDRAGNTASKKDDHRINVVDKLAPAVTVTYEADSTDTKVQFTDKNQATVNSFEKAATAYYNGNVTATIVVDEANFFEGAKAADGVIHQIGIKLTKTDDNGQVTVTEYLPAGAAQLYPEATPATVTWTTAGDQHTFAIPYADNADYVLEVTYTDLSTNQAGITANDGSTTTKTYTSKTVTVDKVAPVVSVVYGNEKRIHTVDDRDYYDAVQTATITVKEHNFRADDFAATVTAKDILGDAVKVEDFKATLANDAKWTKDGNTYTIEIVYGVDANYTFDYTYADLAQNVAADYAEDRFTVDTTAPKNLTISYSTSVLDRILESITFGYYNAQMTVTITAEDDTAGVYYFVYSYLKSAGVSDVNAECIEDKIADANERILHEGKKSTTSFTIPKLLLEGDNQFNGTVEFTAYDRAENNTEKVDNRRVIVDNIAPTATITYNTPVQIANEISYYDGNIEATIVINEANFYSEDVVVTVVKDGAAYPVAVAWTDNSVDVHTGTFTFTEDGDYYVTVEYTDRSDNVMTSYTSNRLTLDTRIPTVNVTNIKQHSANKDEVYGFTITANDINFDATTFDPVLMATIRNEDGSYSTQRISLGDRTTVEAGKTYTYTVDNLDADAVYSLTCTVKDMSGNTYDKLALSDGAEHAEVRFSINRDGSTFAVDKSTDDLVNQYYVYSVDADVVIEEVNVDPVETYVVKLNGEVLTEGEDYTSTLSNHADEWSKRTYTISKKLFEAEGEYSIVVESTDKAQTTVYSDVRNLNVSFVVDQTAPVLTISGLENGGRYQVDEQTVTVIPTDDGGRLYGIKVVLLTSDGEPLKDAGGKDISVRFEMSGEEFLAYLAENGGKLTFTIPESKAIQNQVKIICTDCAVNAEGETNEYNETFTKVTVSQSGWIIFYANKPLFYGSVAGVVLLVGGIIFLIYLKKRKKEEKK